MIISLEGCELSLAFAIELPDKCEVVPVVLRALDARHRRATDSLPEDVPVRPSSEVNPASVTNAIRHRGATCRIHSKREGSAS